MTRQYNRPLSPVPLIQDVSLANWLAELSDVQDVQLVSTFTNSWANAGGAYLSAGYYKDPFGRVHLQGRVSGGTSGQSAFTLPVGYRPKGTISFRVEDSGTSADVTINTSGEVICTSGGGTPAVHLDSVSFRAV